MKLTIPNALFSAVAMVLLVACDKPTTCKGPVGAIVPKLDPKAWEGRWRGPKGLNFVSKIKNTDLGVVTISGLRDINKTDAKPSDVIPPFDVIVRTLKGDTIVSLKEAHLNDPAEGYLFARVAISDEYLVIFPPNGPLFFELKEEKLLDGTLKRDKDGAYTKSVTLEELSDEVIDQRLANTRYKDSQLFTKDPLWVFFHDASP